MNNTALPFIIRAHFNTHSIPEEYTNMVQAHLAAQMGMHFSTFIQPHLKNGIWQRLYNRPFLDNLTVPGLIHPVRDLLY